MRRIPTGEGVEIAVHDLGGDGPELVAVHAAGLHARTWLPLVRHLAGRRHVLALDVRGHGHSTAPPGTSFAWTDLAADVVATVAALGLRRPAGLGHSMGASLLLLAEQARPGTFAELYCIEPIGAASDQALARDPDHPLVVQAARRRRRFPSRADAVAAYAAKPPFATVTPEALAAYVEFGFEDTAEGDVSLRCDPAHEAAVFAHGLSHPVFRDLGRVRCPVTLAVGGRSPVTDAAAMQLWADRLPGGRVEVLAGLGHFAPMEDPAAVAAAVLVPRSRHTGALP